MTIKISQMTNNPSPALTDLLEVDASGTTYNESINQILTVGTSNNVVQAYNGNLQGLSNINNSLTGPVFQSGLSAGVTQYHLPVGSTYGGTSFNNVTQSTSFGDQINFTNTGTITVTLQQGSGEGVGYYFEGILSSTGTINFTGFTGNTVYGTTSVTGGGTNATTILFRAEIIAIGGGTQWYVSVGYNPNSVAISGGTVDGASIGSTTASTGKFTTLSASSGMDSTVIGANTAAAGTFTSLTATSGINNTAIGATTASTGKFTTLIATSGMDSTIIGANTAAAGTFTSLTATSGINSTAIGATTPSTGAFTSLTSSNFSTTSGLVKYDGTKAVTSSTAKVDTNNYMTNSSQPLVTAYVNTGVSNVTGDGTNYTVIFNSTVLNQSSSYNTSNGLFAAPTTANYLVSGFIGISNLGASHTAGIINIVATGGNYQSSAYNYGAIRDANNNLILPFHTILPITNGNSISIQLTVSGGSKVVGILGSNSTFLSYLNVMLLPA